MVLTMQQLAFVQRGEELLKEVKDFEKKFMDFFEVKKVHDDYGYNKSCWDCDNEDSCLICGLLENLFGGSDESVRGRCWCKYYKNELN